MSRKTAPDLMASEVRTRLRSMILGAEFKPGQRLVEEELMEVLGAGRTPVREALLLLQGEGFISRQRGWVVHDVDRTSVHEIFESRAAIEGAAARLAARHVSDAVCGQLDAMIAAMDPATGISRSELNRINTAFHNLVVATAQNAFIAQFHERTQFYYWMLRIPVMFSDQQLLATNEQHRAIVDALRRRDEEAAERAARAHVETTMQIVEPALQF